MVTGVPTGPLDGLKLNTCGVTRKLVLLVSVPAGVTTLTWPVPAPEGTLVVMSEDETISKGAAVPSNVTAVAPARYCPQNVDRRANLAGGRRRLDEGR